MEDFLRIYLAHPFSKKAEVEAEYQPLIEKLGIEVINPFQRGEQAVYDKALATTGLTDSMCVDIVRMDLEKIDAADGVVALMVDNNMIGTIMEIFYAAHVAQKPVWTFTPRERERNHPWIRYYSTVCPTIDDLVGALGGR